MIIKWHALPTTCKYSFLAHIHESYRIHSDFMIMWATIWRFSNTLDRKEQRSEVIIFMCAFFSIRQQALLFKV